jgi:hypothetical protein
MDFNSEDDWLFQVIDPSQLVQLGKPIAEDSERVRAEWMWRRRPKSALIVGFFGYCLLVCIGVTLPFVHESYRFAEESPGEQRIGLQGGDINRHGLMGVGDGQGVEVCRGDAEVLREQLRGVGQAGDTTVVVMQDDEVPSQSDLTTADFSDDAQHRHRLKRCRGDSTADIADYGGLTGHEAEYIDGGRRGDRRNR